MYNTGMNNRDTGGKMSDDELKRTVYETAVEMAQRGYGWAQEGIVLREVAGRLKLDEKLPPQQKILTAWHDLFLERKLSWGYDLDNPNWPFFHLHEEAGVPTAAANAVPVGQS